MRTVVAIAMALAATTMVHAQFEGRAEVKFSGGQLGGTGLIWLSPAGARSELEITSPGLEQRGAQPFRIVTIQRSSEPDVVYTLNEKAHTYSIVDTNKLHPATGSTTPDRRYRIEKRGEETVAGVRCQAARIIDEGRKQIEVCMSPELSGPSSWISAATQRVSGDSGLIKALGDAGLSGLPVRMVIRDEPGGPPRMTMELVSLTRQSVPGSMFDIPHDFQRTELVLPR